jgi:hypothetical protein
MHPLMHLEDMLRGQQVSLQNRFSGVSGGVGLLIHLMPTNAFVVKCQNIP